jgi:hypothetical protein
MKKVRRIVTIKNWSDNLYIIYYNFFYTDFVMHKQGVMYEKNSYRKKTIIRLKLLFCKIRKIIKRSSYEELLEELKKPEKVYLQRLRDYDKKWLGKARPLRIYIPEEDTKSSIFVSHMSICQEIAEILETKPLEKSQIDSLLKRKIAVLKGLHESFRDGLQNYGYIIKKEKPVKYLRNKKNEK